MNYILVADFKPVYTPFDYTYPPAKEYIPPILFTPLELIINKIETALLTSSCTPEMVQELTHQLELNRQVPFESPEVVENAKRLLDNLQDRTIEIE